jgi:hypothetical protein
LVSASRETVSEDTAEENDATSSKGLARKGSEVAFLDRRRKDEEEEEEENSK